MNDFYGETIQTKFRKVNAVNSLIMQRVLNPVKIIYQEITIKKRFQMKRSGSDTTIDEEPSIITKNDKINDLMCNIADKAIQTDTVVYTKSIRQQPLSGSTGARQSL